ncbi:DUF6503 family protein [Aquimarina muelleri]|uniref:Deoxyribose-phosphate aldolase n=1 Tax=Aquimarina muelleri TaxID=279356 RepID=A0A918JXZ8_9FLAO|nr:DUF6503 family protein [Aquimarina muelleri]MCX2763412.1 deoxyribose-phosphate aldolase [Aquimarina muelleri]GGX28927.1 hypothetical protein GCM10007384_32650 [Aquimarina muelleri]
MQRSLIILLFFFSFSKPISAQISANEIINKTIDVAGGKRYDNVVIYFTFRNKQYRSKRSKGVYELERSVKGANGITKDVISNSGLKRFIENCPVEVADSLITKISDGVNSVHYFANLPYGLNSPAVHKKLIGEAVVKGNSYYKIRVTFSEEGGGTDFEDEFLYWIHKDNFTVDYLAYKYAVNGGGIRFREAYNPRVINGIRFADYKNYKTDFLNTPLSNLDKLFKDKQLKFLSEIELEDIFVYIERDCC